MFATADDVKLFTGYEVHARLVLQAQTLIEGYVGKSEFEIDNPADLELLRRATAFQAAYISNNYAQVLEQMKVAQQGVAGSLVSFRQGDDASPYIAGTAQLICKNLSWMKSRSVHTGRIFQNQGGLQRWESN